MSDYDFSSLNDKEFEELTADLLTRDLGARVERFKAGKDGGVDGRFFSSKGYEVIIQCKHWVKSGVSALIRSIEKTEVEKVTRLSPHRYIFVTSLGLSRSNKQEIKQLFSPHILTESDVFGKEDLNDILSKNKDIESKHYKLWISSTNVLTRILHSGIVGRSRHKLKEIVEESRRYVVTQNHNLAMDKLEQLHSVIITGSPGVGKTSLADQLCQFYTANGFEFCFIENSLSEAENVYSEETKQVFYFDDFLGRNFLLALDHHQDSHVINFIKRVEKDKKKRFILTSRSNVLNQGKRLSDLFKIKNVDKNEYELSISSLTEIDKAKILYNHIWFGDLGEEFISELYKDKRYFQIIRHQNFNPRLISFITDYHRVSDIEPNHYWDYVNRTLSNPQDIWKNVIEVQLDEVCKHIVIAVSLNGKPISEQNLRKLYSGLLSSGMVARPHKDFESVVRLLVGALLNRTVRSQNDCLYDLFNPSIADFVIANYLKDFNYIDSLLTNLKTSESISNLTSLKQSRVIEENYFNDLLESQLNKLSLSKTADDIDIYKLRILSNISVPGQLKRETLDYIQKLAKSTLSLEPCFDYIEYFEFVYSSLSNGMISSSDPKLKEQLHYWVYEYRKNMDEFIPISKIVALIDVPPSDLTEKLKEVYLEYLSEEITRDVIEEGTLREVHHINEYDYSLISDYVKDRLSELEIAFDDEDVEYVSDCCDIDDIIQSNIEASMNEVGQYEAHQEQKYSLGSSTEIIDDLFDRS